MASQLESQGQQMASEISESLTGMRLNPSLKSSAGHHDALLSYPPDTDVSPRGTYRYQPVLNKATIRILCLEPATDPQIDLRCKLVEVDLSTDHQFEALSYVWGRDEFPYRLHLEDGFIKITSNLAAALAALRFKEGERNLWVDAVCINQRDDIEKGIQVAMMATIYKTATGVLAWLGSDIKVFDLQTASLRNVSRMASDMRLVDVERTHQDILKQWIRSTENGFAIACETFKMARLANFWSIYSSPWFTRMWIVQEALLAQQITLCYGSCSLPWDDFERVMILTHAINESLSLPIENLDYFMKFGWNIVTARDHYRKSLHQASDAGSELAYYTNHLNRRQCKNDLDRVYALLGIMANGQDLHIQPDYSKSVVQVYLDLARTLLQNGHIEILYEAGTCRRLAFTPPDLHINLETRLQDLSNYLPSWAPDYRRSGDSSLTRLYGPQFSPTEITWKPHFGTTFGKDSEIQPSITLPEDSSHRLITFGTLVDIITWVETASFTRSADFRAAHLEMFFAMRAFCIRLKSTFDSKFGTAPYTAADGDSNRAFANALVGGGTDDEYDRKFNFLAAEQVDPLVLWKNYEKCCIVEDGEIYQAMIWERENPHAGSKVGGVSSKFYERCGKEGSQAWAYSNHLVRMFRFHCFFTTDDGYAGLAPLHTREDGDDMVAFVDGANVPFVIRHLGGETTDWALVGPCYIYGAMGAKAAMENEKFGGRTAIHMV